ncbi:MAG TPA: hypothetical protein VHY08_10510 [Bacillota bacterium]|nr:hypothetical protein [Bacillota bacterium]
MFRVKKGATWTGSGWGIYENGGFIKIVTYNDIAPPDWTGRCMGIGSMDEWYYLKAILMM